MFDEPTDSPPTPARNAVNPGHYRGFSNGAELINITEHLTFCGGNAVKYLARATRIDGANKGEILEDLQKAAWYVERAIAQEKAKQSRKTELGVRK